MRLLARIGILLGLAVVPAAALASSSQVWVVNCTKAQYKPKELTIACGDGSNFLKQLRWSSWTTTQASGRGIDEVNNCQPSCVAGRFKAYPVTVTLSKPKTCRKVKGHKVFGHIVLAYGRKHPGNSRTDSGPLFCPL